MCRCVVGREAKRAKFILHKGNTKDNARSKKLRNNNTSMLNGNIETNNKRSKEEQEKGLGRMAVHHNWLCRTVCPKPSAF